MTVLITGATQGIGAELAKAFAQAGYNVAINCYNEDTRENDGEQVAEACRAHGVEAQCFVADVSDFAASEAMVKAVLERFGSIEVLINNAGITRDGLLLRMSEKNFDDVIATNMKSVFNMVRHVTPGMMKKRRGNIINMSSVAGVYGNRGQLNYAASKAGMIGLTKTIAKELGSRNILCNAIAPGFIQSHMTDAMTDEAKQQSFSRISLRRYGTVQDVADTALFLARQTYITGQTILVDGGLEM
jgi:3-oxoacyl-[acyl-carrier protein] reductase